MLENLVWDTTVTQAPWRKKVRYMVYNQSCNWFGEFSAGFWKPASLLWFSFWVLSFLVLFVLKRRVAVIARWLYLFAFWTFCSKQCPHTVASLMGFGGWDFFFPPFSIKGLGLLIILGLGVKDWKQIICLCQIQ